MKPMRRILIKADFKQLLIKYLIILRELLVCNITVAQNFQIMG